MRIVVFVSVLVFVCCSSAPVITDLNEAANWKDCAKVSESTEYDHFFQNGDISSKLKTAGRVSSILGELSVSREKFLRSANRVEAFPMMYYHTTSMAFETALKSESPNSIALLEMIISFFDAYKWNRVAFESDGVEAVEPHWRKYFETALEKTDGLDAAAMYDRYEAVLLHGINAHILYDIPRFVRMMRKEKKFTAAEMKKEFDSLDHIFEKATKSTLLDLRKSLSAQGFESNDFQLLSDAAFVLYARKRAWEIGIGDGPLPTAKVQPKLRHDPASREFFPGKLLERGICK